MNDIIKTGYCFNCREITNHVIRYSGEFKYCDCEKCGSSLSVKYKFNDKEEGELNV